MKLFEVTITSELGIRQPNRSSKMRRPPKFRRTIERITVRREAEERLTGEQKYNLLMAAIACLTACIIVKTFFSLFS